MVTNIVPILVILLELLWPVLSFNIPENPIRILRLPKYVRFDASAGSSGFCSDISLPEKVVLQVLQSCSAACLRCP